MFAVCAVVAASPLAAGESRWHVEGKLGQASVEANFGPRLLGWRVDDEDSLAAVGVGYALHRYVGIQAGYHDFGSFEGLPRPCVEGVPCPLAQVLSFPVRAEITGFSLAAVPRWPVSERLSVYGKLGVLDWDADLAPAFGSTPRLEGRSDQELLAGIGARYLFPRGFGVLLEYESSDLLGAASLGASWRF